MESFSLMPLVSRRFLQLWQGLLTQRTTRILVLAATNLPQHLDVAAIRRFGVRIEVSAVCSVQTRPHIQQHGNAAGRRCLVVRSPPQ